MFLILNIVLADYFNLAQSARSFTSHSIAATIKQRKDLNSSMRDPDSSVKDFNFSMTDTPAAKDYNIIAFPPSAS